jgi:hypothetical protein
MKWQQQHSSLAVIIAGFVLLCILFHNYWLLIPATAALAGFLIPALGNMIHLGWMKLASVLGWINGRILLTIVFYLLLTPLALIARLLKGTGFSRYNKGQSPLVSREHTFGKADFEKPW